MTIYEFIDIVESMPLNWLETNVQVFVQDNQEIVFNFLKDQWELGENEEGKNVGYYKPITENFYSIIDPPTMGMQKITDKPYNMLWHGNLFRELVIDFKFTNNGNYIVVDSNSSSKIGLFGHIQREGYVNDPNTIFGLNEKNYSQLNQYIEGNIIEDFKELLNL